MARVRYPANFRLIREVRIALGLNQEELAYRCGFADPRIIYDMESEKQFQNGRRFEFESLEIVSKALSVPVAVLIYLPIDEIEKSPHPHTWVEALVKYWGIPADAVNHWSNAEQRRGRSAGSSQRRALAGFW